MLAPSSKTALALAAAALAIASTPSSVDAHGYMSIPKPTFTISGDTTQFSGTIDGPSTLTAPTGMSFTTDPESNTNAFTAALKASIYDSVRALVEAKGVFISGATKECGITSAAGTAQPLPAKYVEWSHSSSEGFTPSHQGPCEVWCDDNKVFSDENCAKNYPAAPAELPVDHAQCVGTSLLKIVWLALHSSTWQIYINCAPLEGNTASASSTIASAPASEASEATESPTVTPASASASTSSASETTTTDDEYASSSASTASEETVAPTTTPMPTTTEASTPAPTPSTTKKCTAKTSRKRRN